MIPCTVPGCNHPSPNKEHYTLHLRMFHNRIICPHVGCLKHYTKPAYLADHRRQVHRGERYECGCGRQFTNTGGFYAHLRSTPLSSIASGTCSGAYKKVYVDVAEREDDASNPVAGPSSAGNANVAMSLASNVENVAKSTAAAVSSVGATSANAVVREVGDKIGEPNPAFNEEIDLTFDEDDIPSAGVNNVEKNSPAALTDENIVAVESESHIDNVVAVGTEEIPVTTAVVPVPVSVIRSSVIVQSSNDRILPIDNVAVEVGLLVNPFSRVSLSNTPVVNIDLTDDVEEAAVCVGVQTDFPALFTVTAAATSTICTQTETIVSRNRRIQVQLRPPHRHQFTQVESATYRDQSTQMEPIGYAGWDDCSLTQAVAAACGLTVFRDRALRLQTERERAVCVVATQLAQGVIVDASVGIPGSQVTEANDVVSRASVVVSAVGAGGSQCNPASTVENVGNPSSVLIENADKVLPNVVEEEVEVEVAEEKELAKENKIDGVKGKESKGNQNKKVKKGNGKVTKKRSRPAAEKKDTTSVENNDVPYDEAELQHDQKRKCNKAKVDDAELEALVGDVLDDVEEASVPSSTVDDPNAALGASEVLDEEHVIDEIPSPIYEPVGIQGVPVVDVVPVEQIGEDGEQTKEAVEEEVKQTDEEEEVGNDASPLKERPGENGARAETTENVTDEMKRQQQTEMVSGGMFVEDEGVKSKGKENENEYWI